MENINITISTLLSVLGAISVIGGGITVITKAFNPFKKIKERVDKHDTLLTNDNNRLKEIENTNKIMCKSMFALLDHEITGNSIEKLKKAKTEMQEYLIEK